MDILKEKKFDHLRSLEENNTIRVVLVPKNEAEIPESVWVDIKQQLPIEDTYTFIGSLLTQPTQDFGFYKGELLIVKIILKDDKLMAICDCSVLESQV